MALMRIESDVKWQGSCYMQAELMSMFSLSWPKVRLNFNPELRIFCFIAVTIYVFDCTKC